MVATNTSNFPGQRMTAQRRLLMEIINRADGHLDAEDLFLQAKKQDPRNCSKCQE